MLYRDRDNILYKIYNRPNDYIGGSSTKKCIFYPRIKYRDKKNKITYIPFYTLPFYYLLTTHLPLEDIQLKRICQN